MNLPVRNASISIAICVALLVLSAIIFVSSFKAASNKPHPDSLQIPSAFQEPPVAPTPTPPPSSLVLTQSTSQAVIIGDSIAPCTIPGQFGGRVHSDNSYWRKFDLEKLTGGAQFNVSSVSFGVEPRPVRHGSYHSLASDYPCADK